MANQNKGYTTFYLDNTKPYIASKPIKKFEGQLPEKTFVRTHLFYIVNLKFVDKYDKNGYIFLKTREKNL
ncbi:LytTR family transcriptional regulator DNA-binding domain-containing protein [Aquimarina sp. I32.4]|uniref:LytTR family transcriptional regulator DNA-binding domain-containing protein n=1 Tax=Aquimarina sp. I32.4 TaxID=2053903 RepID=UPI000CDEC5A0|nr:LytTR family transcriptional regulator DNA-binding domain-containing protein [Aquimarina sp. I32.4]